MITYHFARWQQPTFFSASRTVFKLEKINIPEAFWDHFVTTHFKFSFPFPAWGFRQYENTPVGSIFSLPTHSVINFSPLYTPTTLVKSHSTRSTFLPNQQVHWPFPGPNLTHFSAAILTMAISHRNHPRSNTYYSCIIATILQITPITPISSPIFSVSHSQTNITRL